MESGTPADAAVDAPPILKLCVLTVELGKHANRRLARVCLVRKEPSLNWNKGPGRAGRTDKNLSIDLTGHSLELFGPIRRMVPKRKGSVLLPLMWTVRMPLMLFISPAHKEFLCILL